MKPDTGQRDPAHNRRCLDFGFGALPLHCKITTSLASWLFIISLLSSSVWTVLESPLRRIWAFGLWNVTPKQGDLKKMTLEWCHTQRGLCISDFSGFMQEKSIINDSPWEMNGTSTFAGNRAPNCSCQSAEKPARARCLHAPLLGFLEAFWLTDVRSRTLARRNLWWTPHESSPAL